MSLFHEIRNSAGVPGSLENKPGRKPLRLLIFVGLLVLVFALCGCGASKYEAVDLSMPGTSVNGGQQEVGNGASETQSDGADVAAGTEKPAIVLGGTASEESASAMNETESETMNPEFAGEESIAYTETDDYVKVIADTLNVREYDNTNSRIYIQLPQGEVLHRIAYNSQWCCVEYDDGIAYVAADMVEITEAPVIETAAAIEETMSAVGIDNGTVAKTDLERSADSKSMSGDDAPAIPDYQKTGIVAEEEITVPLNGYVVAIDAGHQAKANAEKEPIGPASQTKKAKMPEGAVGTVSGVKEYELTLTIAKQLEADLKSRGYKVIMIRESHDVNLSEAQRSKLANDSEADIFIRLHANSMDNSSIYGAMAMCMTEYNPYNCELSADSYRLSKQIVNNICANTGTKNRGVQKVDNSSSINWCELPVSVVEIGFLSNPDEDRWLQEEEYQGKIVRGISDAVDTYFSAGAEE